MPSLPRSALALLVGFLPLTDSAPAAEAQPAPAKPAVKNLGQPYRITPRTGAQHIALDGPWQLGWAEAAIAEPKDLAAVKNWIAADVPCTVQWALYRAGVLPHPYEHLNSTQYSWVDEKVWYYRRTVDLPALEKHANVFLCFEGIDYSARVWVNGTLLGTHEGMFGGPAIEISPQAKPGANEIVVEVRAANFGNKKGWKPRGPEGTAIKPWVIAGGVGGEMFFPLGIWQGARIEIVPQGHLERPFLVTNEVSDRAARLTLNVEVFAGTHSLLYELHPWKNRQLVDASHNWKPAEPSAAHFDLRLELLEKPSGRSAFNQVVPLETFAGRNFVRREFTLSQPRLWWPNGLGPAQLYRVRLTLLREGKPEDALEFDYGIRTFSEVLSAGPRTADRWAAWQFQVNGRPFFVKGVNWMPADLLLDLPRERYQWLVDAAAAAGVQMFRIWGGGIIETEEFYDLCNQKGIFVWQDFPIGNRDTPEWPQDVWEAQVLWNVFRLRNHPALALYCGGNEFNPYSLGNAATIGIWERALAEFDPTRPFRRTSPDGGSLHAYPDMDPTWYGKLFRQVPFVAETGMHNIPEPQGLRELIAADELNRPLTGMFDKAFPKEHPELMQHFVEYQPSRVPRMLSRASHIDDMRAPLLDALAEGTQIGAGEFYQIFSEQLQAQYPVTTGLLPWVYKRPWPVIAIMLMDGFGQPTAPYYFLKRTYEPTHVLVKLPTLLWAPGEAVPLELHVTHAPPTALNNLRASVEILDATFASRGKKAAAVNLKPGPSVATASLGSWVIPQELEDKFFFVVAELRQPGGQLISRSVYWPRCLAMMRDEAERAKHRAAPQPWITLDKGPWLKPQTAAQPTTLAFTVLGRSDQNSQRSRFQVRVVNTGHKPAFNVQLDVIGARRAFYAGDNFFWLAPGEARDLDLEVLWREPATREKAQVVARAWNAGEVK